jgi:hypothetical protein
MIVRDDCRAMAKRLRTELFANGIQHTPDKIDGGTAHDRFPVTSIVIAVALVVPIRKTPQYTGYGTFEDQEYRRMIRVAIPEATEEAIQEGLMTMLERLRREWGIPDI